jgi:hypothetical protein
MYLLGSETGVDGGPCGLAGCLGTAGLRPWVRRRETESS